MIPVGTLMYKQGFNNVTHDGAVMPSLCIGLNYSPSRINNHLNLNLMSSHWMGTGNLFIMCQKYSFCNSSSIFFSNKISTRQLYFNPNILSSLPI